MKNYLIGTSLLLSSFVAPSFAEESKDFYLSIGGAQTFIQDIEGDTTISGTKYNLDSDIDSDFGYEIDEQANFLLPFYVGLYCWFYHWLWHCTQN